MFVDVRTVGLKRLGMNYTWQLLPPIEAGKDCVNRLAMVSFGPKEPPFDKFPAPPIRALFEAELRTHPPTRFLNMTGWTISLQNMSCDERKVIKHWNHSKSIDVFPTEEPECLGSDSITWEPNLEGEFDLNEVGGCDTAASNACVCAALTNCEWATGVSGVPRCVYTSRPGVPCEACANQPQCVITPEKQCEMKSTPCACVLGGGGCNWDMSTSRCFFDVTASTPCIACPRQWFCSLPEVRSKQPENLAVMGQEEVGWWINVSFDRDIEFLRVGLGSGIMLQCRSKRPGDWAPTFELDYGQLVIEGEVLHINVQGLPNEETRDCDLVISNNAVRGSSALLPFDGLEDNVIFVTIPDGIPPEVVNFDPPNSARGVSLATTVHFHFNENIKFYSTGVLELYILGGNRTDRAADVKIAEISVWDEAVAIDRDTRRTLHVQLTGLLSTTTYYSLTIPGKTISDSANNPFPGIERGVYIFQTGAEEIVSQIEDNSEEQTLTFTLVLASVGVLILGVALVAGYLVLQTVRKSRKRARVVARRDEKMEAAPESNNAFDAESPKVAELSQLDEEWPISLGTPSSPSASSPKASSLSPKTVQSTGQLLSPQMSPKARPAVQVFSKPEELKTQVHDQLRHAGTVVSLADLHVKSNSMMRTIGGKVDDRRSSHPAAYCRFVRRIQAHYQRLRHCSFVARGEKAASASKTLEGCGWAVDWAALCVANFDLWETNSQFKVIISAGNCEQCPRISQMYVQHLGSTWIYSNVKYRINAGIAEVKLDDPITGNGLTNKTVSALMDICVELHGRPDVKVVAFTATGLHFCSGGAFGGDVSSDDAAYAPKIDPGSSDFDMALASNLLLGKLLYLLNTLPQYKVAAIRGSTMGAGISIVASMDFVVAPQNRTMLKFKEATRGLGACCSWQGIIAKIGVAKLRLLCMLAEDVDVTQAKELGLVDEILDGPFSKADEYALTQAKAVARRSLDDRASLKTTGEHHCLVPLFPMPAGSPPQQGVDVHVQQALKRHPGRASPARLSPEGWPHKAVKVLMTGQHVASLHLFPDDVDALLAGLVDALAELHRSVGKVRLLQIEMPSGGCLNARLPPALSDRFREVLVLFHMLPMFVWGTVHGEASGLGLVLCSTFDAVVAVEASFDFSNLSLECPGVADFLCPRLKEAMLPMGNPVSAERAKELGLVYEVVQNDQQAKDLLARTCSKLSECAPNAVAQSKMFIQKIGSTPMEPQVLEELACHIAHRIQDPEFQDSIRQIVDKGHLPAYNRPASRVVPEHLLSANQDDPRAEVGGEELCWEADGTVLI
ncbi:menB [Symbiodinium natans]|uniref:MenB protein n=1 Tax=Symbiodinium natans TaxID=878477 RepID=A0A812LEM5_9DINO|nr:menB [Symbiodinium natans]